MPGFILSFTCTEDIAAQELVMKIGDQSFTADSDVRAGKKSEWTFTAEGKGGDKEKLVYKQFQTFPGLCGFCAYRDVIKVWKGEKVVDTLALPTAEEHEQGVRLNVLDGDGKVRFSIRPDPSKMSQPWQCPSELICCCFNVRCCGRDGIQASRNCAGPITGIGCGQFCSQRVAPEGCIGEMLGGQPCMKFVRNAKEVHCICCLNGASVYNRGEDRATFRFRACPAYELCRQGWCTPMPPREVGLNDHSGGRFKLALGCAPECELDLMMPPNFFDAPKAQMVCCCFEAIYDEESGFGFSKIRRPLGEIGCCVPFSSDKDDFNLFGCALGCFGLWSKQCICRKDHCRTQCNGCWLGCKGCFTGCFPGRCCAKKEDKKQDKEDKSKSGKSKREPWCGCGPFQKCLKKCLKRFPCCNCCEKGEEGGFVKDALTHGYWYSPNDYAWDQRSLVKGVGVTHTSGATPAASLASASFSAKESETDLMAFSTVMVWEMLNHQEESSATSTQAWYPKELENPKGQMIKKMLLQHVAALAGSLGGELLGELGGGLLEGLGDIGGDLLDGVGGDLMDSIGDMGGDAIDGIRDMGGELMEGMGGNGGQAMDGITSRAQEAMHGVADEAKGALEGFEASQAKEVLLSEAKGALQGFDASGAKAAIAEKAQEHIEAKIEGMASPKAPRKR